MIKLKLAFSIFIVLLILGFEASARAQSTSSNSGEKNASVSENAPINKVHVSVGKPRHWTLEDAYYLLTGLHKRTRDIEIKRLTGLDPNAFNSVEIERVRTTLDIQAEYDQAKAFKNSVLKDNFERSQEQADQAIETEKKLLARQAAARIERDQAIAQRDLLGTEIASIESQSGTKNTQLSRLTTTLGGLPQDPSSGQRTALLTAIKAQRDARIQLKQTRLNSVRNLTDENNEALNRRFEEEQAIINQIDADRVAEIAILQAQLNSLPVDPNTQERIRINGEINSVQSEIDSLLTQVAEKKALQTLQSNKVTQLEAELTQIETDKRSY